MDANPDSPDSISSDQLTVDLLSPRTKRRRLHNSSELGERRNSGADLDSSQPDLKPNNNNDVGFVLMDDDQPQQENGDDDEDVRCHSLKVIPRSKAADGPQINLRSCCSNFLRSTER